MCYVISNETVRMQIRNPTRTTNIRVPVRTKNGDNWIRVITILLRFSLDFHSVSLFSFQRVKSIAEYLPRPQFDDIRPTTLFPYAGTLRQTISRRVAQFDERRQRSSRSFPSEKGRGKKRGKRGRKKRRTREECEAVAHATPIEFA